MKKKDTCYQCGKVTIVVRRYKEFISGSMVTSVESKCSDPDCQKRTEKLLLKEKLRREGSFSQKRGFSANLKTINKKTVKLS